MQKAVRESYQNSEVRLKTFGHDKLFPSHERVARACTMLERPAQTGVLTPPSASGRDETVIGGGGRDFICGQDQAFVRTGSAVRPQASWPNLS
jgi:hypothetical protein